MCLYPRLIRNTKYTANKKNGGQLPPIMFERDFDRRVLIVPVGCGRCMECRKQEARKWQVRMQEDIKVNKNGKMVTFTFSDQSIKELREEVEKKNEFKPKGYEMDNDIAKLAVRRFTERWRKKYKKSIRHWLITELGHNGTENVHMHGIVWTDESNEEIDRIWGYGYTWTGTFVNERTINYIIKYVHKQDKDHKEYKPRILTSAGIGKSYTERTDALNNRYKPNETKEYYRTRSGKKVALPVYWRNKIYTESEREELWKEKLDKKERWIDGIKIDISNGEEEYYKILETAREKNQRLGYGSLQIDWNRKRYEEARRDMLTNKRVERAENAPQALRGLGNAPESAESINDSLRSESALKPNKKWE